MALIRKTVKLEIDLEIEEAHDFTEPGYDTEHIPEHATVVDVRMEGKDLHSENIRHYGSIWTIWSNNIDHSIVIDEGDM